MALLGIPVVFSAFFRGDIVEDAVGSKSGADVPPPHQQTFGCRMLYRGGCVSCACFELEYVMSSQGLRLNFGEKINASIETRFQILSNNHGSCGFRTTLRVVLDSQLTCGPGLEI